MVVLLPMLNVGAASPRHKLWILGVSSDVELVVFPQSDQQVVEKFCRTLMIGRKNSRWPVEVVSLLRNFARIHE